MRTAAAIAALAILMAPTAPVQAGEGSPGEGFKLAKQLCADCHAIGKGQPAFTPVPSFTDIAASEHNAQSLRVFLRTPHATMPNIVLTDTQRDDIAAYIDSLGQE